MPDPLYHKNIAQLRAVPGFVGVMNQTNEVLDGFKITPGRITDDHGFLNTHSFVMTSGNKLQSHDKLAHAFTNSANVGGTQQFNFTFEARVRFTSLAVNTWLFEFPGNVAGNARRFGVSTAGKMVQYSGTSASNTQTGAQVITTGVDYHLAFVRMPNGATQGGRLLMFIDGVKVFDATTSVIISTTQNMATPITIGGSFYNDTNDMIGYMDDIRISNFARYEANFTPPTNTDFTEPSDSSWALIRPGFSGYVQSIDYNENVKAYKPRVNNLVNNTSRFNVGVYKTPRFNDYYGPNNIEGIAQIDGVPVEGMYVQLLHRASKRVLRVTRSGPGGVYRFENLASNTTFMILGEDEITKPLISRRNAYVRDFVRF